MSFAYPQPGFHFLVHFELPKQSPSDIRFQQVSGLTVSTEFEPWPEGGENRFAHQLPQRLQFANLVLKRGKFLGSAVLDWARKAVERFEFEPTNLLISLLAHDHQPLCSWHVVNAVPKRLDISGIDAMTSAIVVETLELDYQYFKYSESAGGSADDASGSGRAIGQ